MKKTLLTLKKLFKTGFFHIFGSSVLNKIITFMSSIVLVRIITKVEYGVFTYAWNIYSIVFLLNGLGMEQGVLQLSSENCSNDAKVKGITKYGATVGVITNVFLSVLILGIGAFAPLKIESSRKTLCALFLLPVFQILYNLINITLRVQKRNKEYSNVSVINTALIFCVSAGAAFVIREQGIVCGHYIGCVIALMIGVFVYHVNVFSKGEILGFEEKKILFKISIISMCNNGLSQLLYLLDVFVLGVVDPNETILASYKVATMIPTALVFIPLSFITYIYPYFAEHKDDKIWCWNYYKKTVLAVGILNILIAAILFFFASIVVKLLFGSQYMDAVPIFRILAINYFFSGTFRIISGNILVTQRRLKFNLYEAIVSSIINIIGDYFFIQWWGAIGAAYATITVVIISSLLSTVYLIYVLKKEK